MFLSHMAHAARTTLNALCAEDQAPGLALLELCANAFIPSGVDALSFDYADTKETLLLKKIYKSTSKPLFCYLSPVIYNFIICTNNCEVPIDNPALEGVLEETFDPVGEYFDNNGSNSEKEHEISTSEDSSDDLTPYYIPEEEDLEEGQHKVNPPVHLRDCLAALQAVNDPDRLESALGACENLIRAHYPQRLQALIEVSVELAKILLHLQDDYSIENFTEMRIKSMVALAVFCPEKVATFLSTEFYAVNYSLQQRLDILHVFSASAQEIASEGGSKDELLCSAKSLILDSCETKVISSSEEVLSLLGRNTRRFAAERFKTTRAKANKFARISNYFFYGLLHQYNRDDANLYQLMSEGHLLSALLNTLAAIMRAAAQSVNSTSYAKTIIELVHAVKYHPQPYVVRSALFALFCAVASLPASGLQALLYELDEVGSWLKDIARDSPNHYCQELALSCLALVYNSVQNSLTNSS